MTDEPTQLNPAQPNPLGFDALSRRLYAFVDSLDTGKRKLYGFSWLAIAVVLAIAASMDIGSDLRLVTVAVGFPSGVILFILAVAVVHGTSLKDKSFFQWKQRTLPKKRVSAAAVGMVAVATLLVGGSGFIPTGLGGTLIVFSALSAYNIIRRTQEELTLAALGLPDPREIALVDEEEEF